MYVWVLDFLSLISTLALAGKATVAEIAEAAMTEKRLKFMARILEIVRFEWRVRPWIKLTPEHPELEILCSVNRYQRDW